VRKSARMQALSATEAVVLQPQEGCRKPQSLVRDWCADWCAAHRSGLPGRLICSRPLRWCAQP